MALTSSEVARIKYELGYNVLSVGAEPYIGVTALFDQVIQPYLDAGASTTSNTAVTAATTPTPVALALADASEVAAGSVVIVDVDGRQERATVQSKSGSNVTVQLSLAHSGTYPVTVEGPESIIRSILQRLQSIAGLGASGESGAMGELLGVAGVKRIDDIEFFGGETLSTSRMTQLMKQREYWRDELATALGVERLNGSGGGSDCAVY